MQRQNCISLKSDLIQSQDVCNIQVNTKQRFNNVLRLILLKFLGCLTFWRAKACLINSEKLQLSGESGLSGVSDSSNVEMDFEFVSGHTTMDDFS